MTDKIPFEIWKIVFNHLQSKTDQNTCQIVCKSWYRPANQVFYQSVYLHQFVSLNRFINHLYFYDFGKIVKTLCISINESPYTSSTITLSSLEALIQLLPNLETLILPSRSSVWKLLLETDLTWNHLHILSEDINHSTFSRDQNQLAVFYKFRESLYQLSLHDNPKYQMNMEWQSYVYGFNRLKSLEIHSMIVQNINSILPILHKHNQLDRLHLVLNKPGIAWQNVDSKGDFKSLVLDFQEDSFELINVTCITQRFRVKDDLFIYISKPVIHWLDKEREGIDHLLEFSKTVSSFKFTIQLLDLQLYQLPLFLAHHLITHHFLMDHAQPVQRSIIFRFFHPFSLESTLYIPSNEKNMDVTLIGKKKNGCIYRSASFMYPAHVTKDDQWFNTLSDALHLISHKITALTLQLNFATPTYYFQDFKDMQLHHIILQFPNLESITIYQAKANQLILPLSNTISSIISIRLCKVHGISRHLLFNLSSHFPSLSHLSLRSCHFYSPNQRFIFDMHQTDLEYLDIDHLFGFQSSKLPSSITPNSKQFIFVISQKSKRRCFYRISSDLNQIEEIESDSIDDCFTIYFFFKRLKFIRFLSWKENNHSNQQHRLNDWKDLGVSRRVIQIKQDLI